jgi:hypothetical protein
MRFIDGNRDVHMIVMWSGGIDSTFKLASLLKETAYKFHAHHVHLVNAEGRAERSRPARSRAGKVDERSRRRETRRA